MKLVIYTTIDFNADQGGLVVQYHLASLLKERGVDTQVRSPNNIKNDIYNVWYDGTSDDDTVVLYSEVIEGNPFGAKRVVRWILADLGIFSPVDIYKTWGPNDLIYYFNGKHDNRLTIQYISPKVYNMGNVSRKEYCHAFRKSFMHDAQTVTPPTDSYEIQRHANYIKIFNEYTYFICYDPLTFLLWMAPICGCITIIHPYKGLTKKEWIHSLNLVDFYVVAYGYEPSEIEFARNTLHLAKGQLDDFIKYNLDKLPAFIKGLQLMISK